MAQKNGESSTLAGSKATVALSVHFGLKEALAPQSMPLCFHDGNGIFQTFPYHQTQPKDFYDLEKSNFVLTIFYDIGEQRQQQPS